MYYNIQTGLPCCMHVDSGSKCRCHASICNICEHHFIHRFVPTACLDDTTGRYRPVAYQHMLISGDAERSKVSNCLMYTTATCACTWRPMFVFAGRVVDFKTSYCTARCRLVCKRITVVPTCDRLHSLARLRVTYIAHNT